VSIWHFHLGCVELVITYSGMRTGHSPICSVISVRMSSIDPGSDCAVVKHYGESTCHMSDELVV